MSNTNKNNALSLILITSIMIFSQVACSSYFARLEYSTFVERNQHLREKNTQQMVSDEEFSKQNSQKNSDEYDIFSNSNENLQTKNTRSEYPSQWRQGETVRFENEWKRVNEAHDLLASAYTSLHGIPPYAESPYDVDNYFVSAKYTESNIAVANYVFNLEFYMHVGGTGTLTYNFKSAYNWVANEDTVLTLFLATQSTAQTIKTDSDTAQAIGTLTVSDTIDIDQEHINANGDIKIILKVSSSPAQINTFVSIYGAYTNNYFVRDEPTSDIRSNYRYLDQSSIEHEVIFESFMYLGNVSAIVSPTWKYASVFPFCSYEYDSSSKTHNFSNLKPLTYSAYFIENASYYLSINETTSDYFIDDTNFEQEFQNDWKDSSGVFTETDINTSIYKSGSSSIRLEDLDNNQDAIYIISKKDVVDKEIYISFWYYIDYYSGSNDPVFRICSASDWAGNGYYELNTSLHYWQRFTIKTNLTSIDTSSFGHGIFSIICEFNTNIVIFIDQLQIWESNVEVKTKDYRLTEISSTLKNFDGYQNINLSYFPVELQVFNESYLVEFSYYTYTDLHGLANITTSYNFTNQAYYFWLFCNLTSDCSVISHDPRLYWDLEQTEDNLPIDLVNDSDASSEVGGEIEEDSIGRFGNPYFGGANGTEDDTHYRHDQKTYSNSQDWTVSGWYYHDENKDDEVFFGDHDVQFYFIGVYNSLSASSHRMYINYDGSLGQELIWLAIDELTEGYHHLLFTTDASENTTYAYIDGVYVGLFDVSTTTKNSGTNFRFDGLFSALDIGGHTYSLQSPLDEYRLFDELLYHHSIRNIMYLHSAYKIANPTLIDNSTISVTELTDSIIISSENNTLSYRVWLDQELIGNYHDLDEIPKNIEFGNHSFIYYAYNDDNISYVYKTGNFTYNYTVGTQYNVLVAFGLNHTGFTLRVPIENFRVYSSFDNATWNETLPYMPDASINASANLTYTFNGYVKVQSSVNVSYLWVTDLFNATITHVQINLTNIYRIDIQLPIIELVFSNDSNESVYVEYNRYLDNLTGYYDNTDWKQLIVSSNSFRTVWAVRSTYQIVVYSFTDAGLIANEKDNFTLPIPTPIRPPFTWVVPLGHGSVTSDGTDSDSDKLNLWEVVLAVAVLLLIVVIWLSRKISFLREGQNALYRQNKEKAERKVRDKLKR